MNSLVRTGTIFVSVSSYRYDIAVSVRCCAACCDRQMLAHGPTECLLVFSRRDVECAGTVEHMFDQADVPERVYVGVCEQNHELPGSEEDCTTGKGSVADTVQRVCRQISNYKLRAPVPLWCNRKALLQHFACCFLPPYPLCAMIS